MGSAKTTCILYPDYPCPVLPATEENPGPSAMISGKQWWGWRVEGLNPSIQEVKREGRRKVCMPCQVLGLEKEFGV